MIRILGAVLAGGQSSRFGSDKAMAVWNGRTLLDWAILALSPHVETIILCGRSNGLADRPWGQHGPLAGINAALHHARAQGFDAVLTIACDTPVVEPDLLAELCRTEAAAFVEDTPVIGFWPASLACMLDEQLQQQDRSMRAWTRRICAKAIRSARSIPNINRPSDLSDLDQLER
jgi:molybdenum cofactor guanylyltransferase